MELYPGWSARDNYGYGAKKKKRKKERAPIIDTNGGTETHEVTSRRDRASSVASAKLESRSLPNQHERVVSGKART